MGPGKTTRNKTAHTYRLRLCEPSDISLMLQIINSAAQAYRDVIPPDCWQDPYMAGAELMAEINAGVTFTGYETQNILAGIMGIQSIRNVSLVRHAYVSPLWQGKGVGTALIKHLLASIETPVLIGTWRSASWAIDFYERLGFQLVPGESVAPLLRNYWDVPDLQVENSTVLARPSLSLSDTKQLIENS